MSTTWLSIEDQIKMCEQKFLTHLRELHEEAGLGRDRQSQYDAQQLDMEALLNDLIPDEKAFLRKAIVMLTEGFTYDPDMALRVNKAFAEANTERAPQVEGDDIRAYNTAQYELGQRYVAAKLILEIAIEG